MARRNRDLVTCLFPLGLVLLLDDGELEGLADSPGHLLPQGEVDVLVPSQHADPGLHVVVHVERHVFRLGYFACWVGDLVFGSLVFEREFAPVCVSMSVPAVISLYPFVLVCLHIQ